VSRTKYKRPNVLWRISISSGAAAGRVGQKGQKLQNTDFEIGNKGDSIYCQHKEIYDTGKLDPKRSVKEEKCSGGRALKDP